MCRIVAHVELQTIKEANWHVINFSFLCQNILHYE